MTPKEKAIELVGKIPMNGLILKYGDAPKQYKEHSKQCALIAVDEIIKMLMSLYKPEYTTFNTVNELMYKFEESNECEVMDGYEMVMYYDEVKQEIEKL
jgi:hypothetical protein